MKKVINFLFIVAAVALLSSCATTAIFPVSSTVPAAEISAKKKQDKQNNFVIEITALNLASADRLTPPKNNYSVWIVTENNRYKNIGQITNKNAKKAFLQAVTPFNVKEIFITAEDHANSDYPYGVEISRTSFKK